MLTYNCPLVKEKFMHVGCDVVLISRFANALQEGGERFLERVFAPSEVAGSSAERLAGIFAAKEAAVKALGLPAGRWQEICVLHDENGAPRLLLNLPYEAAVSISHDGDYAFAVVIAKPLS